jgi:hypothetical protein
MPYTFTSVPAEELVRKTKLVKNPGKNTQKRQEFVGGLMIEVKRLTKGNKTLGDAQPLSVPVTEGKPAIQSQVNSAQGYCNRAVTDNPKVFQGYRIKVGRHTFNGEPRILLTFVQTKQAEQPAQPVATE